MKPMYRAVRRTWILAVVLTVAAEWPAPAQEVSESQAGAAPELAAHALTVHEVMKQQEIAPKVNVQARFDEFQRDFAEDFGGKAQSEPPGKDVAKRVEKALEKRWSGSSAYRLYERLEGVYNRGERFYQRLETSTRWATRGVTVDPDLEAAVDGKLRLNVHRKLGRFDMGLNVDDAISGKLGLRMGGVIRGYKVGLDVSDMINDGRISFQLRRVTK